MENIIVVGSIIFYSIIIVLSAFVVFVDIPKLNGTEEDEDEEGS